MADSEIILVNASVEVDDEAVTVEGNSIKFVEGQGTSTTKAASRGGKIISIHSDDVTTKVGKVMFEMPSSVNSLNVSRDIKAKGAGRVVRISGTDAQGNRLGRTLTGAILQNDPDKALENEGKLTLEFAGNPLIAS